MLGRVTEQGQQLPAFISDFPRRYWTNDAPVIPSFRPQPRPTSLQRIIPASQRTHLHAPQNALKWKYSPSMQPFLDLTPERCLNRLGRRHIRFWIFSRFLFLSIFILFFSPHFRPSAPHKLSSRHSLRRRSRTGVSNAPGAHRDLGLRRFCTATGSAVPPSALSPATQI